MKGWLNSLIIGPFKFMFGATAVVYAIAGTAAAAAFVYLVFSITGMTLGFTVGGAPVIVTKYHEGQAQMEKLVQAKDCPKKMAGKATPPNASTCG